MPCALNVEHISSMTDGALAPHFLVRQWLVSTLFHALAECFEIYNYEIAVAIVQTT